MSQNNTVVPTGLSGINAPRLFVASCFALISTAFCFVLLADIMGALKQQFVLTNEQVGWIVGAGTWGFTLSIFILGPLCDALGMRRLMRFAFLCHLLGVIMMIFAGTQVMRTQSWSVKFWLLFFGALIVSLGNGTVEAACNPLIATIYPDKKTHRLNQFHMWFPGGIVIGGLIAYALAKTTVNFWQVKLAVILLPTIVYGLLFAGQKFPATERVQSGISFGGMVKETLFRPLFIVLFFGMMITASLELGPQRWIPSVLESGGIPGILVLVWITGLMAVLRFFAGPIVHRLSNTGVLLISAILAGIGLVLLSFATSIVMAGVAATIFALGVCYFWPTMLGTAAERVPKGGAMALSLLGGIGMLVVGVITTPQMGNVADYYLHKDLTADKAATDQTLAALRGISLTYPAFADVAPTKATQDEIRAAVKDVDTVLAAYAQTNQLPEKDTANAFRNALKTGPGDNVDTSSSAMLKNALEAKKSAGAVLAPADNYGGLMSFRYVAPLSVVLILIFGILYLQDRKRGGYQAEKIIQEGLAEGFADGVPPDRVKN